MKEFTVEQISRHNLQGGFGWKYTTFGRFYEVLDDLWIVINGKVYDVSTFDCHPGGKDILIRLAGQDASKEFEDQGHSATAIQEMKKWETLCTFHYNYNDLFITLNFSWLKSSI